MQLIEPTNKEELSFRFIQERTVIHTQRIYGADLRGDIVMVAQGVLHLQYMRKNMAIITRRTGYPV